MKLISSICVLVFTLALGATGCGTKTSEKIGVVLMPDMTVSCGKNPLGENETVPLNYEGITIKVEGLAVGETGILQVDGHQLGTLDQNDFVLETASNSTDGSITGSVGRHTITVNVRTADRRQSIIETRHYNIR